MAESDAPRAGRLVVVHQLAELISLVSDPTVTPYSIVAKLRKMADWIEAGAPPKPKREKREKTPEQLAIEEAKRRAATESEAAVVQAIHSFWQEKTGKDWALNDERRRVWLRALRMGYERAKIEAAIVGCMQTPHNNGTDPRNPGVMWVEPAIIVRNLDRFADTAGWNARVQPGTGAASNAHLRAKLNRELDEAYSRGDSREIARLERAIRSDSTPNH